ncbi:MAG: hypothetical protein HY535_00825 [Chloroflexi bacterium]|nr:hypothetical protein [Chloroflexota bacterium]
MYDIHCHLLPGVDDGPETLDDALTMASLAREHGTRMVVTTPHGAQGWALGGKDAMAQRLQAFRDHLKARGNDLEVTLGGEYLLEPRLLGRHRQGETMGLNGSRYLLVEIDFFQYPLYTEDLMFQLQLEGAVPVLAHPERQANIQERPELLATLVERGVLAQITAGSLLGAFGPKAQRSAETLLHLGLVHAVASDGHSAVGARLPVLAPVMEPLQRLVGEKAAETLVVTNPAAMVANGQVVAVNVRAPRRFLPGRGRRP